MSMFSSCMLFLASSLNSKYFALFPVLCSSAVLRNSPSVMPGTSAGVWKERNMPSFARLSAVSYVMSCPLKEIFPPVTL